jgi:hypothetical protein
VAVFFMVLQAGSILSPVEKRLPPHPQPLAPEYRGEGRKPLRHRRWYIDLPEMPSYAGCKSWVELEQEAPTAGAVPVLDDETFAGALQTLHRLFTSRPANWPGPDSHAILE